MAETGLPAEPINETYDIFLCTRFLPDALTPETAALRQLCSALIGEGYRVFFPSAALADKTLEEKETRILHALQSSRVMVAAAVGQEGAEDAFARRLWSVFQALAKEDPSRCFISCLRDTASLPEELQDQEILDMGDLRFLVTLKEKLSTALAPVSPGPEAESEPPTEEAPAPEAEPETPTEEAPAPEAPPAPEEAPAREDPPEEAPPKKKLRWQWLALAAAGVILLALIIALCVK